MAQQQAIKLKIAGKSYSLTLKHEANEEQSLAEKEELYRLAEREVNAYVTRFEKAKYEGFSTQDCLAMGGVIKNDHLIWDTRIKRILDREHEERTVIELYKECRVPVWVGRKNLSDRASSVRNILLYPKAGISLALDETREYAEDHAR